MLFQRKTRPTTIEFLCAAEDQGVIPEPQVAKKVMPDWFRALPAVDSDHLTASDNGLTVKRCMPFLDAMTTGWIVPLAADVRLEIKDNGQTVNAGWGIRQGNGEQPQQPPGQGQSEISKAALQVSQLLDNRHSAGLELPVCGAAQSQSKGFRDCGRHCRYRQLRITHPLSFLRHRRRWRAYDQEGYADCPGHPVLPCYHAYRIQHQGRNGARSQFARRHHAEYAID